MIIIEIIDRTSEFYPELLKNIKKAPEKIYVLGNLENLNSRCFAIIGSRRCTEYGEKAGKRFAYDLAKQGFTIVSGLALGIDSSAHIGALEAKGKTIAVLGDGFDYIYPKENFKLFEEILKNDGTVITEYAPNIQACADNFRKRNRIVSGISLGVLVVEAAEHSGTGITVNYARTQRKPIFSIPSNINNLKGAGTNRLLKRDGILVTDVNDILEYYDLPQIIQTNIEEIIIKPVEIKPEYKKIYDVICEGPIHINKISQKLNISIAELNSTLLMMELEGIIESLPANMYKVKEV